MKPRKLQAWMMFGIVTVATLTPWVSSGAETSTAQGLSNRSQNRLGVFVGVGAPDPGLLSLNIGYNLLDLLRAEAGYSSISTSLLGDEASATTIGAGVKAFVPGWSLSPTLGLHYAHVSYTGSGVTVGGFDQSGGHVYASVGIDWQGKGGYNFGVGYNHSFRSGIEGSAFVQLGWFFDLTS